MFFVFFNLTCTSQVLDNPWSQIGSVSLRGKCLFFHLAEGSAFPTVVDCSWNLRTHAPALAAGQGFSHAKVATSYCMSTCTYSVRLGTVKLTLVWARFTSYKVTPSGTPIVLVVPDRARLPRLLCRGRPRACVIFSSAAAAPLLLRCCCYVLLLLLNSPLTG